MVNNFFKKIRLSLLSIVILATLFVPFDANAKIEVTTLTSLQEIKNHLQGEGVTITDLRLTHGSFNQIGRFTKKSSTSLGLANGLLISTGYAYKLDYRYREPGGYPKRTYGDRVQSNSSRQDPDLATIMDGVGQNDLVIIEFNLTPAANNITIDFAFGSDEYNHWVGSKYVDAYGFFIKGPGIDSTVNTATLPNGDHVSTNFVNNGSLGKWRENCIKDRGSEKECPIANHNYSNNDFFINNNDRKKLALNGWTKVITSRLPVQANKTYKVKLVIADGNDAVYDSVVFIDKFKSYRQINGRIFEHTLGSIDEAKLNGGDSSFTYFDNTRVILLDENYKKVDQTTTHDRGLYSFKVENNKVYKVVVDASSINQNSKVIPEQTWSSIGGLCTDSKGYSKTLLKSGACYGGKKASESDKAGVNYFSNAQHIIEVNAGYADSPNLNFGFSYDVVINTNDSGQGSLRQFIRNTNAGAGLGKMVFVPAIAPALSGYWEIQLTSPLQELSRSDLELNGLAVKQAPFQPHNGSISIPGESGPGGPVETRRPDIDITSASGTDTLFSMNGSNQVIHGFAIKNGSHYKGFSAIFAGSSSSGKISSNYIGFSASTNIDNSKRVYTGIRTLAGSKITIQKNRIRGHRGTAILFEGSGVIEKNQIEDNDPDKIKNIGIDLGTGEASRSVKIINNRIINVTGSPDGQSEDIAIDGSQLGRISSLIIENNKNILRGNLRLSAIASSSNAVKVTGNIFSETKASAVVIKNALGIAQGNRITQNSFYDSDSIPIDRVVNGSWHGDGETANTGDYVNSEPNLGLDRPIITSAFLVGSRKLTVSGVIQEDTKELEFYTIKNGKYEHLETFTDEDGIFSGAEASYTDPVSHKKLKQKEIKFEWTRFKEKESTNIAAIAIDKDGNTSEFSPPVTIYKLATITVTVWKDDNNDGRPDGDPALQGVKVKLTRLDTSDIDVSTVLETDNHGVINFNPLHKGEYQVEVIPNQEQLSKLSLGKHSVNPQIIKVESGKTAEALFGYIKKIKELVLAPNHNRTAIAGTQVILPHKLIGPTGKTVKIEPEWISKKDINWQVTLTKVQCDKAADNTTFDTNAQVAIRKIELDDNGQACLEARFFVPANTPTGLLASLELNASVTIDTDNNSKTLEARAIDTIRVVDSASGSLRLEKTVQNLGKEDSKNSDYKDSKPVTSNKAAPGDILEYTITFTNIGSGPITDLEIRDRTPVFTFLESISCNNSQGCIEPSYQPSYTGELIWTFSQKLAPGEQGEVSYRVKIE